MRRRSPPGALLVAVLALAGCAQSGSAGERVSPTTGGVVASVGSSASPEARLVTQARLLPCPQADPSAGPVDGGLPDVTLTCLGGGPAVPLARLRGTPLVVNIWGSWCAPCREELPAFAAVAAQAGTDVRFLGLDAQDDPDSALQLLASSGVRYPSVRDDDGVTRGPLRWAAGLPQTRFVRADGTIAYAKAGAITSADELRSLIRTYLGIQIQETS